LTDAQDDVEDAIGSERQSFLPRWQENTDREWFSPLLPCGAGVLGRPLDKTEGLRTKLC